MNKPEDYLTEYGEFACAKCESACYPDFYNYDNYDWESLRLWIDYICPKCGHKGSVVYTFAKIV